MHNFDVVIIGAGAAGLMCAATASGRGRKVLLIDHAKAVGEKIRISGGGRCNFTNLNVSDKNFLSHNSHFCVSALKRFTSQDFISLIKKHQIDFHEKTLGQLFCNNSSKEIIEMLLRECTEGQVEIKLETKVNNIHSPNHCKPNSTNYHTDFLSSSPELHFSSPEPHFCHPEPHFCHPERSEGSEEFGLRNQNHEILRCAQDDRSKAQEKRGRAKDDSKEKKGDNEENQVYRDVTQNKNFYLETNKGNFSCQSLVIATGGLSIPKMGATGFGYEIARQFGIKVTQTYPALVPFTFEEKLLEKTKLLSGISVPANVSCNNISFREAILFTHRGISGPSILQISSYWKHGEKITVNLAPETDIYSALIEEKKLKPKQEIQTFLSQFLPKNLADFFAKEINHRGNLADLSHQKIKEIANLINSWSFIPSGTEGYAKAEVTLGGVDVNEISSKNFESKKIPNLFFIGEVLDVTGWLGGYNFQWAWASGKAAGEAV
ncbi:MAG: NAD(P)/FAD-dependent oxidoreductase [Pelagibacterales bacterium]|nr:NAD(P)/FAD-dependent oxidoreductase [Pelagibacterales bacterium]